MWWYLLRFEPHTCRVRAYFVPSNKSFVFSDWIDHLAERDLRHLRQCPHFSIAVFWYMSLRILPATEENNFDLVVVNMFPYILANVAEEKHINSFRNTFVSHSLSLPTGRRLLDVQSVTNRNSSSWTAVGDRIPQWTTMLISTHKYNCFSVLCLLNWYAKILWCPYRAFAYIHFYNLTKYTN